MKDFVNNFNQIDVNFDSHFNANFHEIDEIAEINESD